MSIEDHSENAKAELESTFNDLELILELQKEKQEASHYTVPLIERLNSLGLYHELDQDDTLTLYYEWNHGREFLSVVRPNGGKSEYIGTYHPKGSCENNPCTYCGKVVEEWERSELK